MNVSCPPIPTAAELDQHPSDYEQIQLKPGEITTFAKNERVILRGPLSIICVTITSENEYYFTYSQFGSPDHNAATLIKSNPAVKVYRLSRTYSTYKFNQLSEGVARMEKPNTDPDPESGTPRLPKSAIGKALSSTGVSEEIMKYFGGRRKSRRHKRKSRSSLRKRTRRRTRHY